MKIQRKLISCVLVLIMISPVVFGQSTILNTDRIQQNRKIQNNSSNKELSYSYINENDILWSKEVWEYVDIRAPKNRPLLATVTSNNALSKRASLFDILVKEVNMFRSVDVYTDSYFTERMNRSDIKNKLTSVRKKGEYVDYFEIKSEDIYGFLLKGIWYFDKRESKSKFRLLGIAPMGPDVQTLGVKDIDDKNAYELFWVYYPSLRKRINNVVVYDKGNQANALPLDYFLISRQYEGVEIEESSVGNSDLLNNSKGSNLFQLKKVEKRTDSVLLNKEKSIWAKKKVIDTKPKRKKFSLRDLFKRKKLTKKDSIAVKKKDSIKKRQDSIILERKYQH